MTVRKQLKQLCERVRVYKSEFKLLSLYQTRADVNYLAYWLNKCYKTVKFDDLIYVNSLSL